MSLLMYLVWEDHAEIMTDTLVCAADGLTPVDYALKLWPLPESNMVMAVTGTANIGSDWFRLIESSGADIEDLNKVAPEALRAIQSAYGDTGISTVYHFGFPVDSTELLAYEYTSRDGNNFESRRIPQLSFAAKPGPIHFKTDVPYTPEDAVELARRLREEQDQKIAEGMPGARIGGDLVTTVVTNHNIQITQVGRFSDYDEILQQMQPAKPPLTMEQARASFPPIQREPSARE